MPGRRWHLAYLRLANVVTFRKRRIEPPLSYVTSANCTTVGQVAVDARWQTVDAMRPNAILTTCTAAT